MKRSAFNDCCTNFCTVSYRHSKTERKTPLLKKLSFRAACYFRAWGRSLNSPKVYYLSLCFSLFLACLLWLESVNCVQLRIAKVMGLGIFGLPLALEHGQVYRDRLGRFKKLRLPHLVNGYSLALGIYWLVLLCSLYLLEVNDCVGKWTAIALEFVLFSSPLLYALLCVRRLRRRVRPPRQVNRQQRRAVILASLFFNVSILVSQLRWGQTNFNWLLVVGAGVAIAYLIYKRRYWRQRSHNRRLLFPSALAAEQAALELRCQWDGCNSIELTKKGYGLSQRRFNRVAEKYSAFCYQGEYCLLEQNNVDVSQYFAPFKLFQQKN